MSAVAEITIKNLALSKIGADRILSETDTSKQARVMNLHYAPSRDAVLSADNWVFAMRRALLPALFERPAFGYNYAYQLPDDYLRLVQVNEYYWEHILSNYRSFGGDKPYEVEGTYILTNVPPPLKIRYVRRTLDTHTYSPWFVQALAIYLGREGGPEILNMSQNALQIMKKDFQDVMSAARTGNALETAPAILPDDSIIASRHYGGGF